MAESIGLAPMADTSFDREYAGPMLRRARRLLLTVVASSAACGSTDDPASRIEDAAIDVATDDARDDLASLDADASLNPNLGAACTTDEMCGAGLVCYDARRSPRRWPANGMCSAPCEFDRDCTRFLPKAICTNAFGTKERWCIEACDPAGPPAYSLIQGVSPDHCHGRGDMSCGAAHACGSLCGSDDQCRGGICQTFGGYCEGDRGQDVGWGTVGTPDSAGTCGTHIGTGGPDSFCTAECVLGAVPSCNWKGPPAIAELACVHINPMNGNAAGDRAMCSKLCDCDADCILPLRCRPLSDVRSKESGRKGACEAATIGIPCGADAGVDASPSDAAVDADDGG
jgi:hypothetical protein